MTVDSMNLKLSKRESELTGREEILALSIEDQKKKELR
jgi:hypothetical protein